LVLFFLSQLLLVPYTSWTFWKSRVFLNIYFRILSVRGKEKKFMSRFFFEIDTGDRDALVTIVTAITPEQPTEPRISQKPENLDNSGGSW
jgi:hypothetical protein